MSRLTLRARRAFRDLPVAVVDAPKGSILIVEAPDEARLDELLPVAGEIANRTGLYVLATVRDEQTLMILRPGDPTPVPLGDVIDRPKSAAGRPTAPNPAQPVRY